MDGRTDGDRWTDRDRWTDSHRKTNRQSDGGQVKGRGDRGLTINRSLASTVKFEFEKRCGVWWTMKTRTNTITHHSSLITSYSTSNLFDRLFVHLYFKLLIVCYVLLFQGIRLMSKCAKRMVVWRHHFNDVIIFVTSSPSWRHHDFNSVWKKWISLFTVCQSQPTEFEFIGNMWLLKGFALPHKKNNDILEIFQLIFLSGSPYFRIWTRHSHVKGGLRFLFVLNWILDL